MRIHISGLVLVAVWLAGADLQAQYRITGSMQLYGTDINDLCLSPDGLLLAATTRQRQVTVFQTEKLDPYALLEGHQAEVYAATFSPDGRWLATAAADHQIILWNTTDWTQHQRILTGQENITALAFSPDGRWLASAATSGLRLFDTQLGQALPDPTSRGNCWAVAFSADGKLFSAAIDNTVRLWRTNHWAGSDILYGPSDAVFSLAFSPDAQYLAAAGADGKVYLWQYAPPFDYFELPAHTDRVQKVAFSPDGQYLVSGGSDRRVCFWTPGAWTLAQELTQDRAVADFEFFDNARLAVATTGGWVHGLGKNPSSTGRQATQTLDDNPAKNAATQVHLAARAHNQRLPQLDSLPLLLPSEPKLPAPTAQPAMERRIALLIGNAAYAAEKRLENPLKDIDSLERAFRRLGFEVQKHHDLDRVGMVRALNQFSDRLLRAKQEQEYVVALFYYSGHGVQVNNKSYLIPVNDNIGGEEDVTYEGLDLKRVYAKLDRIKADVNLMVIDACRNNPFEDRFREAARSLFPNTEQGLATPEEQPDNVLVAYATSPSQVALDGTGDNSPYVHELLRHLHQPVSVEDLFKLVRRGVRDATAGKQVPWTASTLLNDFSFVK